MTVPSAIKVGESTQATATAMLGDGTTKSVTSGWQSDTPVVATVTSGGQVTGVGNGLANIFVISDGVQGTKSLRVVPDYQGQWGGTYVIDQATPFPSSVYQHMCANDNYLAGAVISVSMTVAQSGESLTGQYTAGNTTAPFVSLLNGNGGTIVSASSTMSVYRYDYTWRLNAPASSRLSGAVVVSRTGSAGLIGGCTIEGHIVSLTKI